MNNKVNIINDDVFNIIINQRNKDIVKGVQILFDLDVDVNRVKEYLDKYYDVSEMESLRCIEKARLYFYYESDNHCDYYINENDKILQNYINGLINNHRNHYHEDDIGIDYIVDMIGSHR